MATVARAKRAAICSVGWSSHQPHQNDFLGAVDLVLTAVVAEVFPRIGLAAFLHRATGEAEAALQIAGFLDLREGEGSVPGRARLW
jgi:hypothetical protein